MLMAAEPPADREALTSMANKIEKEGTPLSATKEAQREVKVNITNILGLVTSIYAEIV
jgi:hypothetical protein